MRRGAIVRGVVLALAVWVVLGVLRFKPWKRPERLAAGRETLQVGFLPVT
ncbi:MAG: hypothetical protein K0Q72_1600 [Armatimonadetes bacterium]|jgi:hypothetical protein|nr:hypothetical protein [Armatimonadota bacterium]